MLGAGAPGGAEGPEVLGEEEGEQGEEHAGDFKPEDGAGVGEGVPEGAGEAFAAFAEVAGVAAGGVGSFDARGGAGLLGNALRLLLGGGGRSGWGREDLFGGEARADAERASEGAGSHAVSVSPPVGYHDSSPLRCCQVAAADWLLLFSCRHWEWWFLSVSWVASVGLNRA
jgi:hypothetical protein